MVKIEFVFTTDKAWKEHYGEVVKYIGDTLGDVRDADNNERWSEPERGQWGGCTFSGVSFSDAKLFAKRANGMGVVPGGATLSAHRVQE